MKASCRISKRAQKWFAKYAFEITTVRGVIKDEKDANEFMAMRLFGLGFPYKAKRLGIHYDTKNVFVEITVAGMKFRTYFEPRSVK